MKIEKFNHSPYDHSPGKIQLADKIDELIDYVEKQNNKIIKLEKKLKDKK